MVKMLFLFFLIFFLVGCQTTTSQTSTLPLTTTISSTQITTTQSSISTSLSTTSTVSTSVTSTTIALFTVPSNIIYDSFDQQLRWNGSSSAISYELSINDVIYVSSTSYFDLADLGPGSYNVKIRAFYSTGTSEYSSLLPFEMVYEPLNVVHYDESILEATEVEFATNYVLRHYLNEEMTFEITSSNPIFELSQPFVPNSRILIEAYRNTVLLTSVSFSYSSKVSIDRQMVESSVVFPYVEGFTRLLINQLIISSSYIQLDVENKQILVDKDAFISIINGEHMVWIKGEKSYLFLLEITEKLPPEQVGDSLLSYIGQNVIFEFNLHGGTLDVLSGFDITEDDYTFDGVYLVISAQFISTVIQEQPTLPYLMLTYVITNDPYSTLGYLLIKLK